MPTAPAAGADMSSTMGAGQTPVRTHEPGAVAQALAQATTTRQKPRRPGAAFQHCACGKGAAGLCKGQSVKSGGYRLKWGPPGSQEAKFREFTLIKLMGRQKFAEQKERLMAIADLRVHPAHYPEVNMPAGKTRKTPVKTGKHAKRKAFMLRTVANDNGPVSQPIDMDQEATLQAMHQDAMPTQQLATRSVRRALESADNRTPSAASSGDESDPMSARAAVAALRRELLATQEALRMANEQHGADQRQIAAQAEQIRQLQAELVAKEAAYKKELEELRACVADLREEAGDPTAPDFVPLHSWMLHSRRFKARCKNYTGLPSARAFDAFADALNQNGWLDSVDPCYSYADAERDATAAADDSGATQGSRVKKPRFGRRALAPKEAIFFVLMRLRTGLDIIDLHALFGVEYGVACRYFAVYVSFLRRWLEVQFPMPTEAQLHNSMPASFKKEYGSQKVQLIIDAHEQQCEEPSNLMARRTVWSDYKHRCTNKFLGACSPCGACVFASTNYGGKCDDVTLTEVTGLMDNLLPDWITLADKGFMMHAQFAEHGHILHVPSHAQTNVPTYTRDEMRWTNKIGKTRIHVERMFKRAQEFKILHRTIKISSMDLAGTVFKVCCFMGNFDAPLIRQAGEPLRSLSEIQWGR